MAVIRRVPQAGKAKLSGWVRDQNILGEIPQLSDNRIQQLIASPMPSIGERADRMLSYVIRKQETLDDTFNDRDPALIAVTYSRDAGECEYLTDYLSREGLIHYMTMGETEITPAGHMRYEELQAGQPASAQGFVAMWFHETTRDAYISGFEVGVRNAGYDPLA